MHTPLLLANALAVEPPGHCIPWRPSWNRSAPTALLVRIRADADRCETEARLDVLGVLTGDASVRRITQAVQPPARWTGTDAGPTNELTWTAGQNIDCTKPGRSAVSGSATGYGLAGSADLTRTQVVALPSNVNVSVSADSL